MLDEILALYTDKRIPLELTNLSVVSECAQRTLPCLWTVLQKQTTVTAYFLSKQLSHIVFAWKNGIRFLITMYCERDKV